MRAFESMLRKKLKKQTQIAMQGHNNISLSQSIAQQSNLIKSFNADTVKG